MQLYLRPFYNILRQQNNFEWTTEHQKRFEEIRTLLTEQLSNTNPDSDQPLHAIANGLSNVPTSNKTIIQTTNIT